MKTLVIISAMIMASSSFASECTLELKEISLEHSCIEKLSDWVLTKKFETAEECFDEAIQIAKRTTLAKQVRGTRFGMCGNHGMYSETRYSFVEWKFGSLFNFEIPVSGKVNSLTNKNIDGFQKGNQVFDIDGYLIH